ncbi:MAG: [NiFe]-hydrogenase assembly chaperone HybE [Maricaulaceae bacterium]
MSGTFEGSFAGALAADAVLECGVCWHVYDPALGDDDRNIPPGTPFSALPSDWRCPCCDADRSKFMLPAGGLSGAASGPQILPLDVRLAGLSQAFQKAEASMVGLPVHNPALDIEMVGFRAFQDGFVGVVVTPWCMNLAYFPQDAAAPAPGAIGSTRTLAFPSGGYSFIMGRMDGFGVIETCSLFSPMDEFDDPDVARAVAASAIEGLFEVPEPPPPKQVSRRFLFTTSAGRGAS